MELEGLGLKRRKGFATVLAETGPRRGAWLECGGSDDDKDAVERGRPSVFAYGVCDSRPVSTGLRNNSLTIRITRSLMQNYDEQHKATQPKSWVHTHG